MVEPTIRIALRPKEAAQALGVSARTVRDWMKNEGLPYARVGKAVLIPFDALKNWVQEKTSDDRKVEGIVRDLLT